MTSNYTPEYIAQQLYAINAVLEDAVNQLNANNPQGAYIDSNTQIRALAALMANLNTQLQSMPESPEKSALLKLQGSLSAAMGDLIRLMNDSYSGRYGGPNIKDGLAVANVGIDTIASAFDESISWATIQIDDARQTWDFSPTAANEQALSNLLTSLQTFLSTPLPPSPVDPTPEIWNAMGITQDQYNTIMSSIKSALSDLVSNPTPQQIHQFNLDWYNAYSILSTLGGGDSTTSQAGHP